MPIDLFSYRSFIFDCDGVLLDSNDIKTQAFYEVALPYGRSIAEQLVNYHKEHGGISRFKKIEYLYRTLLKASGSDEQITESLDRFGNIVRQKLMTCSLTKGCESFLRCLPAGVYKAVISGGLESELKEVLVNRGLVHFFDGIYGSPRTKKEIVSQLLDDKLLKLPAVFIGDSRYDIQVAEQFGLVSIFMSGYSEFKDAKNFLREKGVSVIKDLGELIKQPARGETFG